MMYFILAYLVGAAFFNSYLLSHINNYMDDPEGDTAFDSIRDTHTDDEIRKIKKNTYKVTVFLISLVWPISLTIDGFLYLKHRNNEPKA